MYPFLIFLMPNFIFFIISAPLPTTAVFVSPWSRGGDNNLFARQLYQITLCQADRFGRYWENSPTNQTIHETTVNYSQPTSLFDNINIYSLWHFLYLVIMHTLFHCPYKNQLLMYFHRYPPILPTLRLPT